MPIREFHRTTLFLASLKFDDILGVELMEAYNKPFMRDAATNFIDYLIEADINDNRIDKPLFFKAVAVVQSSGTGKSRMLTEVCSYVHAGIRGTDILLGWYDLSPSTE